MSASDGLAALRAARDKARMIADAAPELLAACEEVESAQRGGDYGKAFDMVSAALAKARGKS